jgi:pheromone shutdown protein TraB
MNDYANEIGERDAFMSAAIAKENATNLVGVVGMMHMDGIERNLVSNYSFTVVNRTCTTTDSTMFNLPIIS